MRSESQHRLSVSGERFFPPSFDHSIKQTHSIIKLQNDSNSFCFKCYFISRHSTRDNNMCSSIQECVFFCKKWYFTFVKLWYTCVDEIKWSESVFYISLSLLLISSTHMYVYQHMFPIHHGSCEYFIFSCLANKQTDLHDIDFGRCVNDGISAQFGVHLN